jgi:hypothetical protein
MKKQNLKSPPSSILFTTAMLLQACGGAASSDPSTSSSNGDRLKVENTPVALVGGLGSINLGTILTLSASISSPAGEYADDVFVRGTNAYISYNVPGSLPSGAIDQINITVPAIPVRTATFTSATTNINSVYVDTSNNVYAIGGENADGSLLQQLTAGLTSFSSVTNSFVLPSHTGTAVLGWGSNLYTLTGDSGGLNYFPVGAIAATPTTNTSITDARGMGQSGSSNLWVVAGGGNLYEVGSTGTILNTMTFSGANNIPDSKSSVHVGASAVAVSLGTQGAALVCMADHQTMATVAAPVITGVDPSQTVTNSVTFGNGLMFVANGAAGVYVYALTNPTISNLTGGVTGTTTACGAIAVTLEGSIDIGSASAYSANNVYYSNGMLYVATGSGGFKVILVNLTSLGVVTGLLGSI